MKPSVSAILSFNGGYVDAAGFLALQGLFTAHVTGNFVTLGATLAFGTTGAVAKLLALPTFCLVVLIATILCRTNTRWGHFDLRRMLGVQIVLLVAGAGLAVWLGPFTDGDSSAAILTGMTLVSAMAIQNTASRIHLASAPPTTLMTGTTTQIMIDLAGMITGAPEEESRTARTRLKRMVGSLGAFALGCAIAALLFLYLGVWCLAVAPVVILVAVLGAEKPTPAVAA
jgi:uncharacterized membrane protein YoaK (UPF0700 family)